MSQPLLSINLSGQLMLLDIPRVMGILNVTPDSFQSAGRCKSEKEIIRRIEEIEEQGADIIDIGGCSTRPGSIPPSAEDEWQRVENALKCHRLSGSRLPVSIDTFRAEIARRAVEKYGVAIINDISGGNLDPEMFTTVAGLHVPYVLTHMRGTPATMQQHVNYSDVTAEVITELSWKSYELHKMGVCDVIIDPGFGFAKTLGQNFRLLDELQEIVDMGMPVLVGLSRKSMVTKTLGCTPEEALGGTIALNTVALMKGAAILRVHDVREAVETVKMVCQLKLTE